MGSKHFENPARRAWWSVHVDAWRRSSLSQRLYCRRHRLTETTFVRWRRTLIDDQVLHVQAEMHREKHLDRRRRAGQPLSADGRSKAVQAFWAMHVEAMIWSGMSVRDYATALRLSEHSLRRWRDLIEAGELPSEWRSMLHPSARPPISTNVSTSAKDQRPSEQLTGVHAAVLASARRPNRRTFTDAEKRAIVHETELPGATVSSVARQHGVVPSMIFRWRVQLGLKQETPVVLATVCLTGTEERSSGAPPAAVVLQDLLQPMSGMKAIDLPDGRRVFATESADPEVVRAHVAERETKR